MSGIKGILWDNCAMHLRAETRSIDLTFLLVVLAAAGCGPSPAQAPPPRAPAPSLPDASAIVDSMQGRYTTCASYEDTGVLISSLRGDDGNGSIGFVAFDTIFDRASNGFRFEWQHAYDGDFPPQHGVIWRSTAGPAHVWWSGEPKTADAVLGGALEGFAGVSEGTSELVPAMLLGALTPAQLESELCDGANLQTEGEDFVGGTMCFRLSARASQESCTVWISKSDFAVVKLFRRIHIDANVQLPRSLPEHLRKRLSEHLKPFWSEETLEYAPRFAQEIEPLHFNFVPGAEPLR